MLELILDVKARGLPIVLISHNMPHVFEVATVFAAEYLSRDCELRIVADSALHAQNTLREGEVGRSPIVIVDMKFHHVPVISNPLFPSQDMDFTAIRSTRSGLPLVTDADRTVWESAQCPS